MKLKPATWSRSLKRPFRLHNASFITIQPTNKPYEHPHHRSHSSAPRVAGSGIGPLRRTVTRTLSPRTDHSVRVTKWSDIDLLLVKDTDQRYLDRIREVLLLLHPRLGVDIVVYTPREFATMKESNLMVQEEIIAKGKVLYKRS